MTLKIIKKVFIKTYGCQMNVYDSEKIIQLLKENEYEESNNPKESDVILLNTCFIREKATQKVLSDLGRYYEIKKERSFKGKETIIGVAGCVAQALGKNLFRKAPFVDLIFGPQNYHNIPKMLKDFIENKKAIIDIEFPEDSKFDSIQHLSSNNKYSAFLPIQEGCDKFCSYCCVPHTRGPEYSRSVDAIENEAKLLVESGIKEITLLGQNVNAYRGFSCGDENCNLSKIIERLSLIDELKRIRYTTSHPVDVNKEMIAMHSRFHKLMPYLHLPFQSGSDKILKMMNRGHDINYYFEIIEKFRENRPDLAISTDIIVGFPGETDEDFEKTLEVVNRVKFSQSYSFKFSPRPNTSAYNMDDQISEKIKSERLDILQKKLREHQLEYNKLSIGTTQDVLIEGRGKQDGQLLGKSPYMQLVCVNSSNELIGKIVKILIDDAKTNSLNGSINI